MNSESNVNFKGKIFPRSCTVCGVFYQSARHYFVHSRKKVACRPKPYTCSKCGRVFNYYWNLIAHEKRKYSCCSKKSNAVTGRIERSGDRNVRSHKTNTSFVCQKCGTLFCYQKSYEKHCRKCQLSDTNPADSEVPLPYMESSKFDSSQHSGTSDRINTSYSSISKNVNQSGNFGWLSSAKSSGQENQIQLDPGDREVEKTTEFQDIPSSKPDTSLNADLENQLVCKICNYSFISAYAWSKHMKKHPSFKMPNNCFACPICREVFYSAYILFRHQKRNQHWTKARRSTNIDEDEIVDANSEMAFPSDNSARSNIDSDSEGRSKLPDSDGKLFNITALTMKLRDRSLIRKKIAKAKLQIKNKSARVALMNKKALERPKCLTCGKFVARSCGHGKSLSFGERFPCKWCSEQFKTVKRVTYHQQKRYSDHLPFECVQCKQRFSTRSCILNHIDHHHKNVSQDMPLQEQAPSDEETGGQPDLDEVEMKEGSGQLIHRDSDLENNYHHLPEDSGPYSFRCSVCSRVFHNVAGYVSHSLNHFNSNQLDPNEISKSKPYECEICSQKFTHHQKVQIHFLWHLKTIASPSSYSKRNTKYVKHPSRSLADGTFSQARLQIAKKSIFTKVQPVHGGEDILSRTVPEVQDSQPDIHSHHLHPVASDHCHTMEVKECNLTDQICDQQSSENFDCRKSAENRFYLWSTDKEDVDSTRNKQEFKVSNDHEGKDSLKQLSVCKNTGLSVSPEQNDSERLTTSKCIYSEFQRAPNPCCLYVFPEVNRFLGLSEKSLQIGLEDELPTDAEASKNLHALRSHFSRLLYLMVNDPELMRDLGWGKRNIDDILEDVLRHLGRKPTDCREKLRKLRSNIVLLFEACIKDWVIEKLKYNCSSTEELVVNILLLCENSLKT